MSLESGLVFSAPDLDLPPIKVDHAPMLRERLDTRLDPRRAHRRLVPPCPSS